MSRILNLWGMSDLICQESGVTCLEIPHVLKCSLMVHLYPSVQGTLQNLDIINCIVLGVKLGNEHR